MPLGCAVHAKRCTVQRGGHTQMGIPFIYAPYVCWQILAYQNVTPDLLIIFLEKYINQFDYQYVINVSEFNVIYDNVSFLRLHLIVVCVACRDCQAVPWISRYLHGTEEINMSN